MRGRQTLVGFAARAHFASPFPITGDLFLIPLFVVGIRIRVVLHICHHPVIQHHIEKYSAFSAKNPPHKQRNAFSVQRTSRFLSTIRSNSRPRPEIPQLLREGALHGGAEGFRLDCDIGSVQMEPQAPPFPPHLHPNARTYSK